MKRRFPTILAITVTFLFAVLATNRLDWTDSSTFLTSLDLRWLDTKFQLRGRLVPGDEVIIVGLDDRTMDSLGSARTFERKHVPALIDQISAAGPRVIGFDILYEDEDASDPRNDALFAEAIERAGNVVLAVRLDLESTTGESGERQELDPDFQELVVQKQVFPAVRQRGTNTGASMIQGYDLSMNLPIHNQAAATFGFVNFHPDAQGFLRYQPQFIEWGGRLYPSLDLQLLKLYLGAPSVTIAMQDNRVEQVQVGDYVIPTD
jgi:adenylate cyclase